MVAEVRGYIANPQPTMTTEEILWVLVGRLVQGGNLHEHNGGQGEEKEEIHRRLSSDSNGSYCTFSKQRIACLVAMPFL